MRRHNRRNRATWFPVLGFENTNNKLITVDVRRTAVLADGGTNILVIPIIPDIDVPADQSQLAGGTVGTSLRDIVEGQSCIIERIVGTIQHGMQLSSLKQTNEVVGVCSAVAVLPTVDDGSGNPDLQPEEIDPFRANNSGQPWLWRRVWVLGDERDVNGGEGPGYLPFNNLFGSVAEGCKIDTKGTKRAIRREQRIFLIHSYLNLFPNAEGEIRIVDSFADLRVIGSMRRSRNRSNFK